MFHPRIGSDRDLAAVAVEGAVEGMSIKFHADDGLAGQGRGPLFFVKGPFCAKGKCHSCSMCDIVTLKAPHCSAARSNARHH